MGLRTQNLSILMATNIVAQGFWEGLPDMNKPVLPRIIPEDVTDKIVMVRDWPLARKVSDFLLANFGNPPKTPILKIPPSELYENSVYTFVWLSENSMPIGTIRYRPWCEVNKKIYWQVDCFCVDSNHRSKGIGTWLLKYLHSWANFHGVPYAIFIKEGQPLPIPRLPFKTGVYAFVDINNLSKDIHYKNINLQKITSSIAKKWIKPLAGSEEKRYIPIDIESSYTSFWYLYKSNSVWLILRAEKTNQFGPTGQLGWLTNIYSSPSWNTISFQEQTRHITACCTKISTNHGWGSIWIDSEWVETGDDSLWKLDGPYYFYSFQC